MGCGALFRLSSSYRDGEASGGVTYLGHKACLFNLDFPSSVHPHPLVRTVQGKAQDTSEL